MDNKKNTSYPPKERGYLEQKPKKILNGLPDPVKDPIVSNNISNAEFDYTYNGEE